jgi:hypothetical protein
MRRMDDGTGDMIRGPARTLAEVGAWYERARAAGAPAGAFVYGVVDSSGRSPDSPQRELRVWPRAAVTIMDHAAPAALLPAVDLRPARRDFIDAAVLLALAFAAGLGAGLWATRRRR